MVTRRERREVTRFVGKAFDRESRVDAVRQANVKFAEEFRALNLSIVDTNKLFNANPTPVETEQLVRKLANNYEESAGILKKWANELARINAIAEGMHQ